MIKIENTEVYGWEAAIRGMRNPLNSWKRSDSNFENCSIETVNIGSNDHDLMTRLANNGSVHAKYRRMITVYADITAPLYWWKEFDTYKVGTVANSCSTMHKIAAKEFTLEDFSCEHLDKDNYNLFKEIVARLNQYRDVYINGGVVEYPDAGRKVFKLKDKDIWWQMIQLLPSSYNQRRTVMLNYEVLANIYKWRKDHKLDEWREFCKWIETLPYSELITGEKKGDGK